MTDLTPEEMSLLILTSPYTEPRREDPNAPDFGSALKLLGELGDKNVKIDAAVVFALVRRALFMSVPISKKKRGRPNRTDLDNVLRIIDGVRMIKGQVPDKGRSDRDQERCIQEAKAVFGKNLERLDYFEENGEFDSDL